MPIVKHTWDDASTFEDIDRDFRFHPAHTRNPKRLTQDDLARFNSRGYVRGFRIFEEPHVSANRRYFDGALKRVLDEGYDSYSIRRWQRWSQVVWDLVTNALILDYVEDLIGPNIVAWGTHFFCKLPGDGKTVAWHQDASYWPLSPTKTVTVWLAIDDSDRENGAMKVIPATHTLGRLEFDMSGDEENSVLPQRIAQAERLGDVDYIELRAGEISLHADMLVHGSDANASSRRRCGFTVRYADACVRAGHGWNENSVICRGSDPSGHWANLPRPDTDILDE